MLKPMADWIVVRPERAESMTAGRLLFMPMGSHDSGGEHDAPLELGSVVAVGPGAKNKRGERLPMTLAVGDWIGYPHHPSVPEYNEGVERFLVMKEGGVLFKIETKE